MSETLEQLSEMVQKCNTKDVVRLVRQCLEDGIDVQEILDKGLLAGMETVGQKFRNNDIFVPEVLMASRAFNQGREVLRSALSGNPAVPVGTAVIATVAGDLHDIGKNLVAMMLESEGFRLVDIGTDASVEMIVDAVRENKADIVALSALLTVTMHQLREVVEGLKKANLRDSVIVMVGGSPVSQRYSDLIGADLYTDNSRDAAIKAKEFLRRRRAEKLRDGAAGQGLTGDERKAE
ncbi:MAG: corrinoid protein [Gracilibacteraceae bacterium]|nr:corrinoid protein [Gracilibacteraceae bacterium]